MFRKSSSLRNVMLVSVSFAVVSLGFTPGTAVPSAHSATDKPPLSREVVRARADALIARMTPEEKAGQLTQYFYFSATPDAVRKVTDELTAGRTGSLLFVMDPVEINRLQHVAVEKTRLKIPLLFGFDVIHGLHTIMPVPIGMAASWDPVLVEKAQSIAASEARAVGLHWAFAPMVDITRDPRWGRIVEGAGEDPCLGSIMAAAQVRGFQGKYVGSPGHVLAATKHFAGYGASLGGRDYDEVNLSDNDLWNVYLPPFKAAIDAGSASIMTAYMALNGIPATGNRWLLTNVLRHQWGFQGLVVSDASAVVSLQTNGLVADNMQAGIRALQSGVDMEMHWLQEDHKAAMKTHWLQGDSEAAFKTLPTSLSRKKITSTELDNAVRHILEAKIRMGLFENPYVDVAESQRVLNNPAHRQVAREAAERSFVLLRNDGHLLPLDPEKIASIAVIGPFADSPKDTAGPLVINQDDKEIVTVLNGIKTRLGTKKVTVRYSPGVSTPVRLYPSMIPQRPVPRITVNDNTEIKRAVKMAESSDITILVLGEAQNMISENASRSSLELPGHQQKLLEAVIATGKPVVLLLMNGRPLDLKDSKPQALMEIWYPGSQGGTAVANVLFGDVAPGGKLPFTWPRNVGQVPLPYAHLLSFAAETENQRYWNESNLPVFPFGYGLSYSSFQFSNLKLEKHRVAPGEAVPVSVKIRNTGDRVADDVAEIYIHQRYGSSSRPIRELKGFERVTLKPGESRILHFTLTPQDLTYWTARTHSFVQDETDFDIYVGDDSTASLHESFEVRKS